MPRAPRLTGCEHHFFFPFDISYPGGRQLRGKTPVSFVRLLVSFFSFSFFFFRFLYFSASCRVSVRELCALTPTNQLYIATSARAPNCLSPRRARPLWVAWHSVYVKRFYPLLFFCYCFAPAPPCGTACNPLPCLLGYCGSRGAESHTYSPHDARSIRVRALRFQTKDIIHSPGAIYSFSLPTTPKERLRNMTTRCCCLASQKMKKVRGGNVLLSFSHTESK